MGPLTLEEIKQARVQREAEMKLQLEAYRASQIAATEQFKYASIDEISRAYEWQQSYLRTAFEEAKRKHLLDAALGDDPWGTPWEELGQLKQRRLAVLMTYCPMCNADRGVPCEPKGIADLHLQLPHLDRIKRARREYGYSHDLEVIDRVERTCPWCGVLCASVDELAAHEPECD